MDIHKVYAVFMAYFRPKRIRQFREQFPEIDTGASVLDVGGTSGWWKMVGPGRIELTILNIEADKKDEVEALGYRFVHGDGRELPFRDREFDLILSNSVIEHVGSVADQRRFAHEILRCGNKVCVQTPNKWFPVEPHLITLGIHWLPFGIARRLVRWCTVWGWLTKPTQLHIDSFLRSTRLLTRQDVTEMFPQCDVQNERFCGLTKSFLITRR